jgi:hypothetical protein
MGEFILARWGSRLRHDSLQQKFSSRGDTADRFSRYKETVDLGGVGDKKTARGGG